MTKISPYIIVHPKHEIYDPLSLGSVKQVTYFPFSFQYKPIVTTFGQCWQIWLGKLLGPKL